MRLDRALVERGLVRSRNQAAQLIGDGLVTVDGVVSRKPSTPVVDASVLEVSEQLWVSRAAHKLLGALDASGTPVPPRVLDAGASTGGFTEVCLTRGARTVHAVDVGHGQLAPELRKDPRVVVHEGLHLRDLDLCHVGDEPVDLVVGDVSFISLTMVLAPVLAVLSPHGRALLLVKPQFEVGRDRLGSGGIVRCAADREEAVDRVLEHAASLGWACDWRGESVLPGAGGNVEYFVRLTH